MSEEFRTGECDTKAHKLLLRFVIDYWLYILHSSAKMSFGSSSHVYAHSMPCIHKSCECAETSDSKVTATARLRKSYIPTIVPEANVASSACVFAGLGVAAIAYCFFMLFSGGWNRMHSVNFTHFNVLFSWHTFVYHSCTAYLAYIGMIFRVYIFFVRSTRHVSSKDVRLLPRKQT